ncbi:MAG: metallophosphoesterase [Candidatus Thorarchaeota archaeon]|nr:metallophosphoesterase [Candidatus Thorarchaeota archaeon]
MRILVISDTHGHLQQVNQLIEKHSIDAVIHCGDLGFLSNSRAKGIPDRELALLVHHSHLKEEVNIWDLDYDDKLRFVLENGLLGDLDSYITEEKTFNVPIYTVQGNHDDYRVVQDILSGKTPIPNLYVITPKSDIVLDDWIRLVGVGGNMNIHSFLSQRKKHSFHSRIHFDHWVQVYKTLEEKRKDGEKVWFITHVSPGKQPILELLSIHLRPDLWFSGHMGVPMPHHYSLMTVYETRQFIRRVRPSIDVLKSNMEKLVNEPSKDNRRLKGFEEYLHLLRLPEEMNEVPLDDQSLREPRGFSKWMRGAFFFNLPDAVRGNILIDTDKKKKELGFEFQGRMY